MPEYRAYILNRDGHIESFEPIDCPDDVAAITAAKRLIADYGIELWQGARLVSTLSRKSK